MAHGMEREYSPKPTCCNGVESVDNVKIYLYVSAAIFGIVALIHIVRALSGWAFQIGTMEVPILASWVGFVITGVLAAWAIRLAVQLPQS